ncbi:MAG TPA: hypothetical protein VND91_08350 [Candidatus Saccharimonadia bacterium]|nr:hypothetical protein [Candidatus Saccharimonadia bacterium]
MSTLTRIFALVVSAMTVALAAAPRVGAQALPNPVLFVTQFPVPADFATIGSVFANHEATMAQVGRGGDLYIRYPDGTLRNLTAEAGFGVPTGLQGVGAIAVRDPQVHWSGTRAIFSMVVGAPAQQFGPGQFYWQLYEVTGLARGQTATITKVANQPLDYNNVQPAYASDDDIIFVCDRPRNGARHLYPQHDEYESTDTPTGLWRLEPATGTLTLLQHSPSGSFTPIVDSYGRVVFTRWDHLQRDQQADADNADQANGVPLRFGTFNYSSEAANATILASRAEVFPEPRVPPPGSVLAPQQINHFFPWQINQDGTEELTLGRLGRQELHQFFGRSRNDDPNVIDFTSVLSGRTNPNPIFNVLQLREDPTRPGRYLAIDAPEFATHASGQLVAFTTTPATNPADIVVEYLTPASTSTFFAPGTAPASFTGHYRNPLPLSDGQLVAAHDPESREARNDGTRAAPLPRYRFRLKRLVTGAGGFVEPAENLTPGSGIVKTISYWDPDVLVSYSGPLWELSPVEVIARPVPPATGATLAAPEQQAFALEGVSVASFRNFLAMNDLAVMLVRNATSRDALDEQQPYNLRVPGGAQTLGAGGTVYDIAHLQIFQGDQVRGIGGLTTPTPGRRVLAQLLNDPTAVQLNSPNPGGPPASVPIASDGSAAAFVPTRRAMAWQTTAPDGTGVVRERYWITFQPGEIRACDGCHGANAVNQAGLPPPQNTPLAFRQLLSRWRAGVDWMFADGFE